MSCDGELPHGVLVAPVRGHHERPQVHKRRRPIPVRRPTDRRSLALADVDRPVRGGLLAPPSTCAPRKTKASGASPGTRDGGSHARHQAGAAAGADAGGGSVERASGRPRRKGRILERYGWGLAAAAELGSRRERRTSAAAEGETAVVAAETPRSGLAAKAWARRWIAMAVAGARGFGVAAAAAAGRLHCRFLPGKAAGGRCSRQPAAVGLEFWITGRRRRVSMPCGARMTGCGYTHSWPSSIVPTWADRITRPFITKKAVYHAPACGPTMDILTF